MVKVFDRERIVSYMILVFFISLAWAMLRWPVVGYDTDLWYHLNGGRYFWQNHSIPDSSFFSYMDPSRQFSNYYWLFQVFVYAVFSVGKYYGIVIFRCVIAVFTIFIIWKIFFEDSIKDSGSINIWSYTFFVLYSFTIVCGELNVRPHLFSWLFIPTFLYIIEKKKELAPLLPLFGILWCNTHGVEYPVLVLITLSYLLEILYYSKLKRIEQSELNLRLRNFLAITLYSIFMTPHFISLLELPFSYGLFSLYISEMFPINPSALFAVKLYPFENILKSLVNLFFVFTIIAFFTTALTRKLRLSHCLIFLGGVVLLMKGKRFIFDFLLLAIPVVHRFASEINPVRISLHRMSGLIMAALLLLASPLLLFTGYLRHQPDYPISRTNLPVGIVKFLNHVNTGGRVLNHPNTGGYLAWGLNEGYRINMDLQMSLFQDLDFARTDNAFYNVDTLRRVIEKYDPSYISVPIEYTQFENIIRKFKNFTLVFFDDKEVLYVNADHFGEVAHRYSLKHTNPFRFMETDYKKLDSDTASGILQECISISALDIDNGMANTFIVNILRLKNMSEDAIRYTERIIKGYPDNDTGYAMKGECLLSIGRNEEAVQYLETALAKCRTIPIKTIYRSLYLAYAKLNMPKETYDAIGKVVDPFDSRTGYKDVYNLAAAAATLGKEEALIFMQIAALKVPQEDEEMVSKIKAALEIMEGSKDPATVMR